MKRFYNYFLSLFLLMAVGISGAMAQAYREGNLLETVEAVTSQDILLNGTGNMGGGQYLCGQGYSSTVTKDCRYRLEQVSGQVDGLNLYVLKQVSTGLYVKDYTLQTTSGDDSEEDTSYGPFNGKMIAVTADKAEAMQFTVSLAVENGTDPRSKTTQGQAQDLSQPSFVLATKQPSANGAIQFLGHYYSPFYAIYVDTNAWQIHAVDEPQGKEKLQAYMDAFFANNTDPSVTYPAGTHPGAYPADLVEAAHAAYQEANDALNADEFTLTDEQVNDLCNRIETTIEKLKTSTNPMADGIYFIHDSRGMFNAGNTMFLYGDSGNGQNYITANGNYTKPAKLDADAVKYLWRVKVVNGDSATIQNVLSGLYFTHKIAVAKHYGLSQSENIVMLRKGSETGSSFNHSSFYIKNTKNTERACTNPAGWVINWNYDNDPGNQFVFESVTEDELNAVLEEAKQQVRNEKLATLYGDAVYALNKGISYAPAAGYVLDNDFSAEGALVRHTGAEDNTPWYCNNKETQEANTYEALTSEGWDGTTYFHSSWSGGAFEPSISKNHYLVAELEQDATGDILVKVAKRATGNDFPTQFAVYGANKFDKENPNATEWKFQGLADINYTDSVAVTYTDVNEKAQKAEGETKTVPDAVGIAAMHLDGSYAYIKLAATKTLFNASNPQTNRGYFALAKLNIWEAAEPVVKSYTPELQDVQNTNEAVITELQAQIEAAGKQVADSSATDAQIASLQAALDAFNNNYPDPSRVTTALAEASSVYNAASSKNLIGDKLAQYPTKVAEKLANVITKYQNFNSVKLADINAAVNEINAAVAEFKASIKLPEAGKFYTLRSAAKKFENKAGNDSKGVTYRAVIYSESNNATTEVTGSFTPVRFYRMDGSSAINDSASFADADFTKLQDTISVADDARLVWKAEASANGQITFRNLATGMYLTGANGKIYQSVEATPINVEGIAPETFRFNAGKDENGVTQYMNAKAAFNTIVTWNDTADVNSNFFIEEVAKDKIATQAFYIPNVKEGQFYAGTFAVDIDPTDGFITPYQVIGVNGDKLVLGEYKDVVEAGTPFIYNVEMIIATKAAPSSIGFTQVVAANDLTEGNYTYETKNVNGLQGVLTEAVKIPAGKAYINNGAVAVAPEAGVDIAANGAYFNGDASTTADEGDTTLELGKLVGNALTGIDATKVIVLPAKVDVYSIDGKLLRQGVKSSNAAKNLPAGVYVIGGQKVLVK